MNKTNKTSKTLRTPEFRVSYPSVFEAKLNDLNGKNEYSLVALLPCGPKDASLAALRAAAQEALVKKFGANKNKWPRKLNSPFRLQEERAKTDDNGNDVLPDGYEKGHCFLTLKSTRKPQIINRRREDIEDANDFYAGCWAMASVQAYAYDVKGNAGVAFGLRNLQKVRDDKALGGSSSAYDDFEQLEDEDGAMESAGEGSSDDFFGE